MRAPLNQSPIRYSVWHVDMGARNEVDISRQWDVCDAYSYLTLPPIGASMQNNEGARIGKPANIDTRLFFNSLQFGSKKWYS